MTPSFEATRLYGKSDDVISAKAEKYERHGDFDIYRFCDGSKIEIDRHWGHQQCFAPNGWNVTPRKQEAS